MGNAPFGKIKWGKINLKGMKNDKKRQFNCPVTYKENNKKGKGKTLKKQSTSKGCVRGAQIPQNRTELRINTAQNNIRKPLTAVELPENFWIPQTAWFCKTAIPQLKIKMSKNRTKNRAKPHHRKPLRPPQFRQCACNCALTLSESFYKCIELISTNLTPFHLSDSP